MSGIGRHGGVWDAVKSPGIVKTGSCDRSRCEQEREVLVTQTENPVSYQLHDLGQAVAGTPLVFIFLVSVRENWLQQNQLVQIGAILGVYEAI